MGRQQEAFEGQDRHLFVNEEDNHYLPVFSVMYALGLDLGQEALVVLLAELSFGFALALKKKILNPVDLMRISFLP